LDRSRVTGAQVGFVGVVGVPSGQMREIEGCGLIGTPPLLTVMVTVAPGDGSQFNEERVTVTLDPVSGVKGARPAGLRIG